MRSRCCESLAAYIFVLVVAFPCFAQAQSGPATLEDLANADEANGADAAPDAEVAADSGPKRPAGSVNRPKDGVQHPDLNKAWAEYDAVVAKAAEGIKQAIGKQFDAATANGDLDSAEKWQAALEKFEKAGEVPSQSETKSAVSAAVADYKKAKEELSKAYEAVVKALTMEKKIADAKAVRGERQALDGEPTPASKPSRNLVRLSRVKGEGYARLVQSGVSLKQGQTYRFTARMKGDVKLQHTDHIPEFSGNPKVNTQLTKCESRAGWTACEATVMPTGNGTYELKLSLRSMQDILITDVSLRAEGSDVELLQNGSFCDGLTNWSTQGGTVQVVGSPR